MKAKNLLIGLIIFLVVLNVATITTVLTHINKSASTSNSTNYDVDLPLEPSDRAPSNQTARYLGQRLNLTKDQQELFRQAGMGYNRKVREISLNMNILRDQLLDEMDRDDPDSLLLASISEEIGNKHVELKKLTIDHYIGLKKLCNDEQKRELYLTFKTIINPEGEIDAPRGQGQGPRSGSDLAVEANKGGVPGGITTRIVY
jgi:uncharacterized membrane protein